jgi:exportin-5
MFTPGSVSLLREVYNWTLTDMDVNDIDDQKYMLCKRLSEVGTPAALPTCNVLLMIAVG